MTNLLKETTDIMLQYKKNPFDIIFIGSEHSGHSCTWEEFVVLADQEYYEGYGCTEVAIDLIIIFNDGSKMGRAEYDGSEWWNFMEPFKMPIKQKYISNLFGKHWKSLAECQEGEDDA